jgi:hypothetical protein
MNEKLKEKNVKNVVNIKFVNDLGKNIQKYMVGMNLNQYNLDFKINNAIQDFLM